MTSPSRTRFQSRLTQLARLSLMLLMACLLTSCPGEKERSSGVGWIAIDTPANGAAISALTSIQGSMNADALALLELKLYIIRYSDGKFWDGTAWGGGGSALLPTTTHHSTSPPTWESTGALPSGTDPATGLTDGHYNIIAIAKFSNNTEVRADSVVGVGVAAPPLTSTLHAWGSNAFVGKLGAGPGLPERVNEPTKVFTRGHLDGKNVVAVAAGDSHTVALTTEGKVYGWGSGGSGRLGTGDTADHFEPAPVQITGVLAGKTVTGIAAGWDHSLAVTSDGLVFAWGSDLNGGLGDNATVGGSATQPVAVLMSGALASHTLANNNQVVAVAAGLGWSVALTFDGKLYSWGNNFNGALGIGSSGSGTDSGVPVAVQGLSGKFITAISAQKNHFLALTDDGQVFACGANFFGQHGDGTTTNTGLPVQSGTTGDMAGKTITRIAAGDSHSLALDSDGRVYAWGFGGDGQLGTGATADVLSPVQIGAALAGKLVTHIGGGNNYSVAATSDGKIYAWGENDYGQLGGATAFDVTTLTPMEADFSSVLADGKQVQKLACGKLHAVILASQPPFPDPEISVEAQGAELTDNGPPPGISFGTQSMGSSTPVWVTVRNSGKSDLTNMSASIDGAGAGDFFTTFSYAALPPNATPAGFNVFFNPTGAGVRAATLHIHSNDADEESFDIPLSGTGYPPAVPESGFNANLDGLVYTTAVQPDGKILLGGGFYNLQPAGSPAPVLRNFLARLNADGTLDTAFYPNPDNHVTSIAVQADGKILIAGYFTTLQPGGTGTPAARNYLARLNEDGTVDTTFNASGTLVNSYVDCIVPMANGQILISGAFSAPRSRIARLDADGTLDASFDPVANGEVLTIAVDAQNRVVMGGLFSQVGGATRYYLARVDSSGVVDDLFNPIVAGPGNVYSLAVEKDGSLLVGGDFATLDGVACGGIGRIRTDNSVDPDFRPSVNYPRRVDAIAVQADGSIIISGNFDTLQPNGDFDPTTRNLIARVFPGGSLDPYFDPNVVGGNQVFGVAIQADGKVVMGGQFTTVGGQSRVGLARLDNNTVTDVLTVPSASLIEWQRGGGAPETSAVSFDLSTDGGTTWTPLGAGFRTSTGWQKTGITLPAAGRVRARARTSSGRYNGSSGIVEKVTIFGMPPVIAVFKEAAPISSGHSHEFGVVATGSGTGEVSFMIQNAVGSDPLTGLNGVSIHGLSASDFTIVGPGTAQLAGGASTILTILFQPKSTGVHTATLYIPSNDPGCPVFEILLSGTGSLPVTTYKQIHFGQTENTGDAADTADTRDHDGNSVLAEYALNLDPNVADQPVIRLSVNSGAFAPPANEGESSSPPPGDFLFFTYNRNKLALADVIFQVEWSSTLATNDWHTTDVSEQVISEVDNVQEVQATVPRGAAGRRFVRLKITRP